MHQAVCLVCGGLCGGHRAHTRGDSQVNIVLYVYSVAQRCDPRSSEHSDQAVIVIMIIIITISQGGVHSDQGGSGERSRLSRGGGVKTSGNVNFPMSPVVLFT